MEPILLMTPGPTPVPFRVLQAMGEPIIHHRTEEFRSIFKEVSEGLKEVFFTKQPVYVFASSGTGAMEASVVNLFSAGDKVLVIEAGKFGERWTQICSTYGLKVESIKVPYGDTITADIIENYLKKDADIKGVFTTLCETSTGVVFPIQDIAKVTSKTEAVLIVDAISGLGADALKMDEWNVDVVVSGSQKGLMIPPGLGFISLSPKAWKRVESATLPSYYFNLKRAKKSFEASGDTPWTPAISLLKGLNTALELIQEDGGIMSFIERSKRLAAATRSTAEKMGLEVFSKSPSCAVTALKIPDGIDGKALVKRMRQEMGIAIAGGQGDLKGKIIRVAHMGAINEKHIVQTFYCLNKLLEQMGLKTKGDPIGTLQEALQ